MCNFESVNALERDVTTTRWEISSRDFQPRFTRITVEVIVWNEIVCIYCYFVMTNPLVAFFVEWMAAAPPIWWLVH
jgi:hypothetical protein